MTDSIDTSDREAEDPRGPFNLPIREMRVEPVPHQPADPLRAALQLALEATPEQLPAALRALSEQPAVAAALGRGVVPSGWKLVPVEPTPEMRKAAADAWLDCDSKLFLNKAGAAVRAAIAISKGSA